MIHQSEYQSKTMMPGQIRQGGIGLFEYILVTAEHGKDIAVGESIPIRGTGSTACLQEKPNIPCGMVSLSGS